LFFLEIYGATALPGLQISRISAVLRWLKASIGASATMVAAVPAAAFIPLLRETNAMQ